MAEAIAVADLLKPYMSALDSWRRCLRPTPGARSSAPISELILGFHLARTLASRAGTNDPWELAGFLGVEVESGSLSPAGNIVARYLGDPPKVILDPDAMRSMAEAVLFDRPHLCDADLPSILLARELFHHLWTDKPEGRDIGAAASYDGPASNAFVQGLLGLPFCPGEILSAGQ